MLFFLIFLLLYNNNFYPFPCLRRLKKKQIRKNNLKHKLIYPMLYLFSFHFFPILDIVKNYYQVLVSVSLCVKCSSTTTFGITSVNVSLFLSPTSIPQEWLSSIVFLLCLLNEKQWGKCQYMGSEYSYVTS